MRERPAKHFRARNQLVADIQKQDDTFVLETGADRVKIRFTKNAISSVEKLNMDNAPKK